MIVIPLPQYQLKIKTNSFQDTGGQVKEITPPSANPVKTKYWKKPSNHTIWVYIYTHIIIFLYLPIHLPSWPLPTSIGLLPHRVAVSVAGLSGILGGVWHPNLYAYVHIMNIYIYIYKQYAYIQILYIYIYTYTYHDPTCFFWLSRSWWAAASIGSWISWTCVELSATESNVT